MKNSGMDGLTISLSPKEKGLSSQHLDLKLAQNTTKDYAPLKTSAFTKNNILASPTINKK